jgi:alanine-synthesizing transaminase
MFVTVSCMFASRTEWNLKQNRYTQELRKLREAGTKLLDLTASNPTICGLRFNRSVILRSLADPKALIYRPEPRGLLVARKAVSGYYADHAKAQHTSARVEPEQIFLTTGTSEAYSFLFRLLCNPGDQVLVPQPSYPLFDFLADIQDVRLTAYPLHYDHGWHIDLSAVRAAIGPGVKAVMVVHPNNPTGSYVSRTEMQQLIEICGDAKLALIADEVFLDYAHEGKPPSFVFSTDCLTFVLSGLSKISCLPQMKVGWIAVNGPQASRRQAEERLEVIADTYLSMNAPLQFATPVLLRERKAVQKQVRMRIERNLHMLNQQISRQELVSRLEFEGGWYAVLRVPAICADEELAIRLMREQHVVIHPGHFYDFPRDGYLIVSLITPENDFKRGINKLLQLFCGSALL